MDQADNELWPKQPLQAAAGVQPVASDIPVSAMGRGASAFTGVMDNTDVFFKGMQAVVGGVRPRVVDDD